MKEKIIGILVCMLLIVTAIPAVGELNKTIDEKPTIKNLNGIEWNITYGGDEFDAIRNVEQTDDDGYICCGLTEESDNFYVYLLKLDSDGNEEWSIVNTNLNGTYVDPYENDVFGMHVLQTPDGGYIANGWSVVYVEVQGEWIWSAGGFLWKTDSTGSTEWIKHYYSAEELAIDLLYRTIIVDEGYVVAGFRMYYDMTGQVIYINGTLFKTDDEGNIEWQQFYDAGGDSRFGAVCATSDGGYLATGAIDNDEVTDGALWMVKTDRAGDEEWISIFDGPLWEYSYVRSCYETSDKGYIMAGTSNSYSPSGDGIDAWVIKTDSSGVEEWNRTYGGKQSDYIWTIAEVDGGYVLGICDNFESISGTRDDIMLVKVTEEGLTAWIYIIEEEGIQIPTAVRQTSDMGYIVGGRTGNIGNAASDGILYKLSPIENNPPDKPKCSGKTKVDSGKKYTYKASTTDPDGDQVFYKWDWGDGNFSEWLGPYDSGEQCITDNYWDEAGKYVIKVRAKDEHGAESEWANSKIKNTQLNNFNFKFYLLNWLLEKIPDVFPIFRYMFRQ